MSGGSQGLAARRAALSVLSAVLDQRRPMDEVLDAALARLTARDRAFARSLLGWSLRRLVEIDGHIDSCLERPLPKAAGRVRHILRLGLAQMLFMDVPDHAAVDTSVRLAGSDANPQVRRLKPLVNGVLRRLLRKNPQPLREAKAGPANTPAWLMSRWQSHYGDKAPLIAAAHMQVPPLDLTLKDADRAAEKAEAMQAVLLPTGSLRRKSEGSVADLPGYAEGGWWVQDAAAALPARLMGDIAGKPVIDLCAAPGGKTAQLAAMGAEVAAVDRSEARLARVEDNLARLDLDATLHAADATEWQPDQPAPAVLLDAPCSATGTIRRHPDLPHIKTPQTITELAGLQARLLGNAASMVAPGGILMYCTCSLEPEEGEHRIEQFLKKQPEFRRSRIRPRELPGLEEALNEAGEARILPCFWSEQGGIDGFFIARLRRAS